MTFHISSTISFCPLGAPLTARYVLPSIVGSQSPGLPSTIMPPASTRIHHPAHTSQAQHPPSQKTSCCPDATSTRLIAADPPERILCTIAPPSSLLAAS